jgi:hypothetical protein
MRAPLLASVFLIILITPIAAQDTAITPYPREQLPIRAAVRVLPFASYLGGLKFAPLRRTDLPVQQPMPRIINSEYAVQDSVDPAVDFVDFVKSSIGDCAYDRRDFVPVTADGRHFALKERLPIDHFVVWHTRIDFHRLSDEAQHALLRTMRAMTTWFCDAYASWQKGSARGRARP